MKRVALTVGSMVLVAGAVVVPGVSSTHLASPRTVAGLGPVVPATPTVKDRVPHGPRADRNREASPSPRASRSTRPKPARKVVTRERVNLGGVWGRLAHCESTSNPSINTGNGYYGLYQFSLRTWRSVGGTGYPHQASAAEQTRLAIKLQRRSGWGQWPHCARKLGLI